MTSPKDSTPQKTPQRTLHLKDTIHKFSATIIVFRDLVGTDGTMFPALMEEGTEIWMFVGQLCRSIWLEYKGKVPLYDSKIVEVYEYRPGDDVFDMQVGLYLPN